VVNVQFWRLLDSEITYDAAQNLAIEEAILHAKIKGFIPPTIRFWRNRRAVIVGYSQNVYAEVNLDVCAREGIQVVKRFSGGGTVYHDLGNLNYTIIIDAVDPLVRGLDIEKSYRVLCSGIVQGLKNLGFTSDEISIISPGSILIRGKKVSGSAQLRSRNVILHHGTLLVNSDLNVLKRVLAVYDEKLRKNCSSAFSPTTKISDELGRKVDISEIKRMLIKGFEESFRVNLEVGEITRREEEFASKIYREKYSRDGGYLILE
jgi:lipoate-protein ligase A